MSTFWLTILIALPAAPADNPESANSATSPFNQAVVQPGSPGQLRKAVHNALRREATAKGAQQQTAIRELLEMFKQLSDDSQEMPRNQRLELLDAIRGRLARRGDKIARQISQSSQTRSKTAKPAGAGQPTADPAQELIELIQKTIQPASWDANGGPGTIKYFPPSQVLVIRQTEEVHDRLGDALRQMREE